MHAYPAALGLLLLASPAMAQQGAEPVSRRSDARAELTVGAGYQTGDYGIGQRIESRSAVAGARVAKGRVILSASLPYTRMDAPGNVVTGGGGLFGLPIIVDPTRPPTRVRRQGVGDLRLGAAWTAPLKAVDLAAYGQVKLPTAKTGLGTGKTDYAVGAEASKRLGAVAPFANVTYTMPGSPEGYRLRKTLAGQAGLNAALGSGVSGQVAYGYAQSPGAALADEQLLSARLTTDISSKLSLSVHGGAGLSKSAPDASAGVQLGVRLF
ncbi:transporter [Sphingomonas psychrotolerans]|uniref:Transporter n=1 Tax=Sphingomonas psychrotolerans TaxID=1327635 RepID=A0ABU3N515_9SPHN|nr:transporter [Sphingomonas psychrotolerans]MDT8759625.1 transporter [Sphingomonas psychrotolerans]